ncbi:MAG TPA: hypothetical protein P5116_08575 [Eubacteriales bacterium]|nr:hypothetical protein [Clostridia bacterium]HRV73913.1 hypothetical protein [Eubacteriales bacterium]
MTKIIAFEGIDGTGKSVQLELLNRRLLSLGKSVMTISFPCYQNYFGSFVGKYLSAEGGVAADSVDGKSMALWFALDRWEAFKGLDYTDKDFLLINRYMLSNAVYQCIRDCDPLDSDLLDFVFELEHGHFGLPLADLNLVLDVDPDDAAHNVDKKGFRDYVGNARDVYEAKDAIQLRARRKYLAYSERMDSIAIVPCMRDGRQKPIDEIAELIFNAIKPLL